MSWTGFVKAVSRATTSVMMASGHIEKSSDKEYQEEEERFKLFQSNIERLHREAKGYLDSVRGLTLAQQRIAETVEQFYDEGAAMSYASMQYKDAVSKLDTDARAELDETFRLAVLDPLGKMLSTFPDFIDLMKKRDRKLLDYDRVRSTVRKLADNPSGDSSKLARAENDSQQAKDLYEDLNKLLMKEIPMLIDLRVSCIEPCFESMVKTQLTFNRESFDRLDAVKKGFEYGGRGIDETQLQSQVDMALQQIRELSICGAT